MEWEALLLLMAVRSAQSWISVTLQGIFQFVGAIRREIERGRGEHPDAPQTKDEELVLHEVAEQTYKKIVEHIQTINRAIDSFTNPRLLNPVRDKAGISQLIRFYMRKANGEDLSEFRDMFQALDAAGAQFRSEATLFMEMKDRFHSMRKYEHVTANLETSGWSMFFTGMHKLHVASHPPETLTEKHNEYFQQVRRLIKIYNLAIFPLFVGLRVGPRLFPWTWSTLPSIPSLAAKEGLGVLGMAFAPMIVTNMPVAVVNGFAIASIIATNWQWGWNHFMQFLPNLSTSWALWSAGIGERNAVSTGLLVFQLSATLLSLSGVKKYLGIGAKAGTELIRGYLAMKLQGLFTYFPAWIKRAVREWLGSQLGVILKELMGIALRIGIGYVASYLISQYSSIPLFQGSDPFVDFAFFVAAFAQNDEQLIMKLLSAFVIRAQYLKWSFGEHGPRLRQLPMLTLPDTPRKEQQQTAKKKGDPWQTLAAKAVTSSREFENIVCALFRHDEAHFRDIFEELRLATTGLVTNYVEYMVDGDESRLPPPPEEITRRLPPFAYMRFTTAVRALLIALSRPLNGRRHYKTDADHPDQAEPIDLADQIGATQIRMVHQTLTRLFYETGANEDAETFGAHEKKSRAQRRAERRQRDEQVRRDAAVREATRVTGSWTNNWNVFLATVASAFGLVKAAADAATGMWRPVEAQIMIGGQQFSLYTPVRTVEKSTEYVEAFEEVRGSLVDKSAAAKYRDGASLHFEFDKFLVSLEQAYLKTSSGEKITRNGVIAYLKNQTTGDKTLSTFLDLTSDDDPRASQVFADLGRDSLTLERTMVRLVNWVGEFILPRPAGEQTPVAPTPPAPPTPPTPSTPSENHAPPPSSAEVVKQISKTADGFDISNILTKVWADLSAYLPAFISSHPYMMTHVLLHTGIEAYRVGQVARIYRKRLSANRATQKMKYQLREAAMNMGPIILDLVLQACFQTTWLSNSERYYFGAVGVVEAYAKLRTLWHWYMDVEPSTFNILRSQTYGNTEMYLLLQFQRSLPLVLTMAMRDTLPMTADLVGGVIAGVTSIMAVQASAAVLRQLFKHEIVPTPYQGQHWARPMIESLPGLVFAQTPWSLITTALIGYAMNVDTDFGGREWLVRLGMAALVAYELFRSEPPPPAMRFAIINLARGQISSWSGFAKEIWMPEPVRRLPYQPTPYRPHIYVEQPIRPGDLRPPRTPAVTPVPRPGSALPVPPQTRRLQTPAQPITPGEPLPPPQTRTNAFVIADPRAPPPPQTPSNATTINFPPPFTPLTDADIRRTQGRERRTARPLLGII